MKATISFSPLFWHHIIFTISFELTARPESVVAPGAVVHALRRSSLCYHPMLAWCCLVPHCPMSWILLTGWGASSKRLCTSQVCACTECTREEVSALATGKLRFACTRNAVAGDAANAHQTFCRHMLRFQHHLHWCNALQEGMYPLSMDFLQECIRCSSAQATSLQGYVLLNPMATARHANIFLFWCKRLIAWMCRHHQAACPPAAFTVLCG